MKKILQINSVVNYGSTGRIAEELGQIAMSQGWESYIASARDSGKSESILFKIGTDWDIKLHGLQTRLFDRHGLSSKNPTQRLISYIEIIKPDIIHLHNLHGYYLNIKVLFNFLSTSNIPVVWTLHDCWAMTGHCAYFDFVNCQKWKVQCNKCPQKNEYPRSIFNDRSLKNYKLKKELFNSVNNITIVTVSCWLASIVKQSFLSKKPIQVINNGIDLVTFSPQNKTDEIRKQYGIGKRFMLLGVATVWSERKGLEDYEKLSKILKDDCVIVLVGLSNKQLKSIPKSIIGLARTESTLELSRLYSAADIILNLSSEETFGLTTIEGFACGTPSIVYNCTASPELVTPETGFIVEKGAMDSLIYAIEIIKGKGKNNYSIACRNKAEKLYNKNDRYQEYINLYELIKNKNVNITNKY